MTNAIDTNRLDWLTANKAQLKQYDNGDYVVFVQGFGMGVHADPREAIDRAIRYSAAVLDKQHAKWLVPPPTTTSPEWRWVPVKPTVAMHNAACVDGINGQLPYIEDGRIVGHVADPSAVWAAMIAAAPVMGKKDHGEG